MFYSQIFLKNNCGKKFPNKNMGNKIDKKHRKMYNLLKCRCGGMADALDSGSSGATHAGSSPVIYTNWGGNKKNLAGTPNG